jgi:argininosuccinate lyase
VLESIQQGKQPLDWTADQLTAFAPEFTSGMVRLLDPAEGMKTREIPGGSGPATVAKALDEAEARIRQWRS